MPELWYRDRSPPLPLRLLSGAFAVGVRARRALYARGWLERQRLPRPVIVVGNLSVGGSGKTPLVVWVAEQLSAAGHKPGIVLRGYGGPAARGSEPTRVRPDSSPAEVGDEAVLLAIRTGVPVAVCAERVRAARLLLTEGAEVIVADDGLQHLALARDFEIAVIDGERGFGNGWLLPAGPLREPLARLATVDAIVLNGEGRYWRQAQDACGIAGAVAPVTMHLSGARLEALDGKAVRPLTDLAGQRVHAVAGIGHPQRFFAQLRQAGLELCEHAFPDHHAFRREDLAFGEALPILMTEKDAVKCRGLGVPDGWYLPVRAEFAAADATRLLGTLYRVLEQPARAGAGD